MRFSSFRGSAMIAVLLLVRGRSSNRPPLSTLNLILDPPVRSYSSGDLRGAPP
jgi:hypothetical protein